MQNWAHVQTFVRKAEAIPDLFEAPAAVNAQNVNFKILF